MLHFSSDFDFRQPLVVFLDLPALMIKTDLFSVKSTRKLEVEKKTIFVDVRVYLILAVSNIE